MEEQLITNQDLTEIDTSQAKKNKIIEKSVNQFGMSYKKLVRINVFIKTTVYPS